MNTVAEVRAAVLAWCLEADAVQLEQIERDKALDRRAAALVADGQTLLAREKKVADREEAVGQVRQVAAERLARLQRAEADAAAANARRLKADAATRTAELEKKRLEAVVAQLLADKTALEKQIHATSERLSEAFNSGDGTYKP